MCPRGLGPSQTVTIINDCPSKDIFVPSCSRTSYTIRCKTSSSMSTLGWGGGKLPRRVLFSVSEDCLILALAHVLPAQETSSRCGRELDLITVPPSSNN